MPNTYTELRRTVLGTATSSVTLDLTGISGYTDLYLVVFCPGVAGGADWAMRLNNDSGSNYSRTFLFGTGSTVGSGRTSNANLFPVGAPRTNGWLKMNIQNYNNTTTNKTILWTVGSAADDIAPIVGLWRSTAAITSIDFVGGATYPVGSTFSLYGIANADQGAAKATGGIITEDANYWYHTFGASGAFVPKQNLTCDYLVIAGGGGGGSFAGGGGGAGGYKTADGFSVTANTNYTVTVGAGGAAGSYASGTNGANSVFGSITSTGGGFGGGSNFNTNGGAGGSGGGASGSYNFGAGTGGAASPSGQGNTGGSTSGGLSNLAYAAAGGGGAGAVGGSANSNVVAGAGGAGLTSSISGTSVTRAGGGGGGSDPKSGGAGGAGGGGEGGLTTASAGTVNTGSGGGGVWNPNFTAAAGGSGIVIIRYSK